MKTTKQMFEDWEFGKEPESQDETDWRKEMSCENNNLVRKFL